MPFKYLEDVAIADITFEATGKDIDEVFKSCADALFDSMTDVNKVEPETTKTITLENESYQNLLYDFLSEILFIKDADYFIFKDASVKIKGQKLVATVRGEQIDQKKHELRNDIKAITFHMFELKKERGKWKATVVMDL